MTSARSGSLTWKLEWEVQSCQHDCKEYPPATGTSDEGESTTCDDQVAGHLHVAVRHLPVSASQATESDDQGCENQTENNVGPKRQDEENEAQETHGQEEESWYRLRSAGVTRHNSRSNVPKLELNPTVVNPAAGLVGSVEYAPYALKKGCKVPPKESQKAPKEQKTTKGKVLPMIHSPRPPMSMSTPPKKKYVAVPEAPLPPAPRHPMRMQLSGESDSRKPTRALRSSQLRRSTPLSGRLTVESDCPQSSGDRP